MSYFDELAVFAPFADNLLISENQQASMFDRGLVLRFLTLKNNYEKFDHDVEPFITSYVKGIISEKEQFDRNAEKALFIRSFSLAANALGDGAWRYLRNNEPRGAFSTYLYDAISVGIAANIDTLEALPIEEVISRPILVACRDESILTHAKELGFVIPNHRVLRLFWLSAFIAWEGYASVQRAVTGDKTPTRLPEMIRTFDEILGADDSSVVPFPPWVPLPGVLPSIDDGPEVRVAAEFAMFAAGWGFLHELRHIKHQQEGTGATVDAAEKRSEELSCDEFATAFLLEKTHLYKGKEGVDTELVKEKRRIGIYFALFSNRFAL
jgi:hypothetical protein